MAEGLLILDDFDIFRDAPGKFTPEIVTVNTYVTDGTINIAFTIVTGDPSINGIEVIYTGAGGAPPVPVPLPIAPTGPIASPTPGTGNLLYRINSGSSSQVVVPPNNLVWDPDQFVLTGIPYDNCSNLTGSIYCTGRYFQPSYGTPFRYDIPIPISNRTYQVRLHFAESVRVLFHPFQLHYRTLHIWSAQQISPNTFGFSHSVLSSGWLAYL